VVTFTDLSTAGSTTINGANIRLNGYQIFSASSSQFAIVGVGGNLKISEANVRIESSPTLGSTGYTSYMYGTWSFANATVTGLSVTGKWG
jgi:hypothetical protein